MKKINKQKKRKRLIETRLTTVEGRKLEGWVKKAKG